MGEAAQFAPAFLGALAQFEHPLPGSRFVKQSDERDVEHAVAAEAAFGALGPVPDRGEGALDWI